MLRAAEPDVMFAQLLDAVPSLVPRAERGAFRDTVAAVLKAADARAIEGNPDRLQFLTVALTCGTDFHELPALQQTWSAVRARATSLADAMQTWDESMWAALQANAGRS